MTPAHEMTLGDFLALFHGERHSSLVAINKATGEIMFADFASGEGRGPNAQSWAEKWNAAGADIYFGINSPSRPLGRKAKKVEIPVVQWVWVECDPPDDLRGPALDAWRDDKLSELRAAKDGAPLPTVLLHSGRGVWAFWKLREPHPLDGYGAQTERVEACGRGLEQVFAADKCRNVDRIARLPGFVNHKTGATAHVVEYHAERVCDLEELPSTEFSRAAATDLIDEDLRDLVDDEAAKEAVIEYLTSAAPLAVEGQNGRKTTMTVLQKCQDLGCRFVTSVELMEEHWNDRCEPPWDIGAIAYEMRGLERKSPIACNHPAASERYQAKLATKWSEIVEIENENGGDKTRRAKYPLEALGDILGSAARSIADKVQCAEALAAQSVLAVASLAAQGVADVRLPFGQTRPLSLFFLTIAESGDRKTTADTEAMKPVKSWESRLRAAYEPVKRKYDIALAAWRAQKSQIDRSKIDFAARCLELEKLGPEPTLPLRPVHTINETTAEGLAKNWPHLPGSLGIFSAEGGQFLGGHGFSDDAKLRTAASLAQLWDGSGLRRLRAGDGVVDLHGRRLAAHLMIQPDAAATVLNDSVLRDQGLLSRLLLASPESLAGSRYWKEPAESPDPGLSQYFSRILSIFEIPTVAANSAGNELAPRALDLSSEARSVWTKFYDSVEADAGPKKRFDRLRDVAAKAAEQAARIAGVLQIVDDPTAETVEGETMLRACALVAWYLAEAVRIASDHKSAPINRDAGSLREWIDRRGSDLITATELLTLGPNRLRSKAKLDPAIAILESQGFLKPDPPGKRVWRVQLLAD